MNGNNRTRKHQWHRWALTTMLLCVIAYCVGTLWAMTKPYRQEAALRQTLQTYAPEGSRTAATAATSVHDQRILDLQHRNRDALGWLIIADTRIDYPFVQATDNKRYLAIDIDGQPAAAGTLFLDWQSRADFQGFNHVIYGHSMKNGSMFGTLHKFGEPAHFEAHPTGSIHLADAAYQLEFFAYLDVDADDAMIYATHSMAPESRAELYDYVEARARHYRDIGLGPTDRIVTLSTCAYGTENARIVLLGRLIRIVKGG